MSCATPGGGARRLPPPDGTVRLVRSALTVFTAQLDAHTQGLCTATDARPLLPVPEETR
ncbi:hypothetical protein [Streptomyces cellostaticus]|uniref:hypothetical protein n=1 Tax=Streptomyces cellostaticus TaxID=67285 RepID=UPI000ACBA87B|nr:hypothetical protein [Streptomyces cellostaticus]